MELFLLPKTKSAVYSSPGPRPSLLSLAEAQLTSAPICSSLGRQSRFSVSEHIWVSGEAAGSISSMELLSTESAQGHRRLGASDTQTGAGARRILLETSPMDFAAPEARDGSAGASTMCKQPGMLSSQGFFCTDSFYIELELN